MITRILLPLLLLILLPDIYLHRHYLRRRPAYGAVRRVLWWTPACMLALFAGALSLNADFAPTPIIILYAFLLLLGLFVVPKALFALCSSVGLLCCRLRKSRRNWGNLLGAVLALWSVLVVVYGSFVEPNRLEVREISIPVKNLPPAFDGYRIALFSDAHVGAMAKNNYALLSRAVDTINARRPDAVCFAGDLQNIHPTELDPVMPIMARLKAPDGVFSVLGNHDYANYADADSAEMKLCEVLTQTKQRSAGWQLLMNEHRVVRRGQDSLVIAGAEDDCKPPRRQQRVRSDYERTLRGVRPEACVVMLQHAPDAWQRDILPRTQAQLTLSGHTHGGQVSFFGWAPISILHNEWGGLYAQGQRRLFVTTGLSGLVPFRYGMPPEVVFITLRRP